MSHTAHGRRPRFATALAAALAVPLALVVATTGRPVAAHAAPAAPPGPDAAASAQAKSTGEPVTVAADTTAYTDVVANPDGSYTLTSNQLPVHARRNGAWVTPDATLHATADGRVAPAAAASGLTLSGGGTGPLATLDDGNGHVLSLGLPMSLPTPQLSGASATYPGVLPGVDLTLTADIAGGVSDVLTVHDATAAANPRLANLTFTTATTNLDLATDSATGAIHATDPSTHAPVFAAPPPLAWDSTTVSGARAQAQAKAAQADPADAPPATSSATRPGAAAHVTPIATHVTPGAITLSTPAAALTGSGVTYPVYVDPGWSVGANPEAYVQSYHPTTSGYNPSDNLRTGFSDWDDGSGWLPGITRDYLWFNGIGATFSKWIQEAHLQLNQLSASSNNTYTLDVNTTSAWPSSPGSGINWSNQPGWTASTNYPTQTRSVSGTNGGYQVDLTTTIRSAQNSNYTSIGLVMHMATESDHYAYRHFSKNPSLVITYWSTPNQPAGLTAINGTNSYGCNTTSPGTWIPAATNNTVDLHYTVSTADSNTPIGANTWVSTNGGGYVEYSNAFTYSSGNVPVDRSITLTDGSSYAWYAQTNNPYVWSPKSATCYFQYDATPPAAPTVSSPEYPANGPTTVSAGGSGTLHLASTGDPTTAGVASGVKGFNYNLNGTSINSGGGGEQQTVANRMCIVTIGGSTQCSFTAAVTTPLSNLHWGTNTLWAQTVDFAGNVSQPVHYDFYVQQSAFGAYTPGTAGDIDGDNNPDLVTVDAAGNLRLFTHPDATNDNPTGDTTADPQQYGGRVLMNPQQATLWPGASFAGALVTHGGSFIGNNADDLILEQAGRLAILENVNANGTNWTMANNIPKPACSGCPEYNGGDWSSVVQMVAVPSATPGGRPGLLTVEYVNGEASVWLYPPATTGTAFATPTRVSGYTSAWHWDEQQILGAGPAPGTTGTSIWVRNPSTGDIALFNNIEAGLSDPNTSRITISTAGYPKSAYPLMTTVGRMDANGDLPLWATRSTGELAVIPATRNGNAVTFAAARTLTTTTWASHELALQSSYTPYNNSGIGHVNTANQPFDLTTANKYAYADDALQSATLNNGAVSSCPPSQTIACPTGLYPAGTLSVPLAHGSYDFTLPSAWGHRPDNYQANGQTLAAPVNPNFSESQYISFLGAASTNSTSGSTVPATVTYTDGTTQKISITLPDWAQGPAAGATTVATAAYTFIAATGVQNTGPVHLFATAEIPLATPAGQQIASITLGVNADVHIFSVAVV